MNIILRSRMKTRSVETMTLLMSVGLFCDDESACKRAFDEYFFCGTYGS